MKIIVIVPTYNEKDNIKTLIPALQAMFQGMQHNMQILVVDDNSPDGTADVVRAYMQQSKKIHLITGEKKGLGQAYIRGMEYAIQQLKADAVMEMDADLSHDPQDVPRLVTELAEYDFIIGSRYVPGGKIPAEWNFLRKLNSWGGNFCARYIAGIYIVKDCTAGFRVIKTSILEQINLPAMNTEGYCFQVSLLHEAILKGAHVKEIPVTFTDRKIGSSKLSIIDVIEFIFLVWGIRLESSKTFLKFASVGLSGLLVNLGSLTLLLRMGLNKFIASPISIEVSIISNFLLNNYWTFARRNIAEKLSIKGLKFNIVSLFSLGISYTTFIAISLLIPGLMPQVAQAIGVIPATITNYFLNSYWTFNNKHARK